MTAFEQGRFCKHCQHAVIDFTNTSDTELYRQLTANGLSRICGRVNISQLKREIKLPPQSPTRLYRIAVGLGLVLLFSQAPDVVAHPRAPLQTLQISQPGADELSGGDSIYVKGQVLDETGEPLIGAIVQLYEGGLLRDGCQADIDGRFSFAARKGGNASWDLRVLYVGYAELRQDVDAKHQDHFFQLQMKLSLEVEYIIMGMISYIPPLLNRENPGANTIISGEQIEKLPYR